MITRTAVAAVTAAAAALVGAGPVVGQTAGPAHSVTINDRGYVPATVTAAPGQRITWTNRGREPHTVTAESRAFDSGIVQPGGRFELVAPAVGSYPYLCTIHPYMRGTLEVKAAASTPAREPAPARTPRPRAARGPSGGEVTRNANPGADYIRGTVTSGRRKAEAGVWVIAETKLRTTYRKIVVTDRRGRFVLPELPSARYRVWVRGYGLRDSPKVTARPGDELALRARPAASRQQAARIYPANYWLSLFNSPDPTQGWQSRFKLGCMLCHQMGSKATRSLVTRDAYDHGTKKAETMYGTSVGLGRDRLLDALADWSGRIAAGETPKAPPRPRGRERNMVITQWNWGDKFTYAHDEIATDKLNPRRNANGPVYGVDIGNDRLLITDPVRHTSRMIKVPTRDGFDVGWCDQTASTLTSALGPPARPAAAGFRTLGCPATQVGGVTAYPNAYHNPANPHNPMMDSKGRIWITTQIRREHGEDLPAWCRHDPVITNNRHHRQLGYYDPKTKKFELIDTCFGTHHLQFDEKGVLWLSGDSYVLGWFDPSKYDPARPETAGTAQGWKEIRVDSDGDGTADRPIVGFNYGIHPNPKDGSVWTAQPSTGARGLLTRYDPATGTFEAYAPPPGGAGPRGVDVDANGIVWSSLGGSGHLGRFDRSKCARTWGPGDQCPEGWTIYKSPGPLMRASIPGDETNSDMHYYLFVDRFNTLGMGPNTPILNGTNSDSLLAFNPKTEKFTTIRIPYPLNSYQRGLDGRIDNPKTGWKGRGLWFNLGLDPILHSETQMGYVAKVQMRPNPLAGAARVQQVDDDDPAPRRRVAPTRVPVAG